jgi:hypothetical protein
MWGKKPWLETLRRRTPIYSYENATGENHGEVTEVKERGRLY